MKDFSMNVFNEAIHTFIEKTSAFSNDYDSEDEDNYFHDDDDDDDESSTESSIIEEKAYVCDYDTIYVCLYEELEEYRISKQAKKKNTINAWNNLLVVTPSGGMTSMKKAPEMLPKVKKEDKIVNQKIEPKTEPKIDEPKKATQVKKPDKIIQVKIDQKAEPKVDELKKKAKSMLNNIITNGSNSNSHPPEVKTSKVAPTSKQKLSKKKLKKQRQKEKKKGEKKDEKSEEKYEEENIDFTFGDFTDYPEEEDLINEDKSRSESRAESLEFQKKIVDEESEEDENSIDLSSAAIPAFVTNALKKNEKKILIKKEEKSIKNSNTTKTNKKILLEAKAIEKKSVQPVFNAKIPVIPGPSSQPSVDPDFDFAVKKIKRPKATGNLYLEAVALGKEAHRLIVCDSISQAIQFLNEAILINSYDLRHFLNRSFCYLRLGAHNLALKDTQVVIKYTSERDELVKAKFRAGQALCGLHNYEEAIKCLDEAYNFSQGDPHIHRELMRARILQLVYMGFRERDIIEAFKESSSVPDVVAILAEKTVVEEDNDYIHVSEGDDDIYNSDDEENPSFTRMMSNLLKDQTALKKLPFRPSSPTRMAPPMQPLTTVSYRKPAVTEAKKIITTLPPKTQLLNKASVNDKAIWVGNTTTEVTENMLRKRFTRFGKIVSIYRKPNESYTFINFETSKAVTELLSSTSVVEVDGHKLPVKAATRAK